MRRNLIALAAFAATLLPAASHAQICTPFTDVPASNPFCGNIQWMLNRGVTSGCGTNLYCPHDVMPRDQMAAFMNRLADKVLFQQGGNAFGAAGELGTTDNQVLEVIANNSRVMRYEPNAISPNVIGGSHANNVTAGVRGATIAGGGVPAAAIDPDFSFEAPNRVTDAYGTVGGGFSNQAGDDAGTTTDRAFSTVGGGYRNTARGAFSTIAGGSGNLASHLNSTIGGGLNNVTSGDGATISGGNLNVASSLESTVSGGYGNTASGGSSTVSGGAANTASGNGSVVVGGYFNEAAGTSSVAMGYRAKVQVNAHGSFVFSDRTEQDFASGVPNEFIVGATGGIGMYTSKVFSTYCRIAAGGGSWNCSSSRDVKRDFEPVDSAAVLDKVVALPMSSWRFMNEPAEIRHLGPMSQDFHAAFGLGSDDRSIASVDAQGVALAAIQGLNAKLEAQAREIAELKQTVTVLLRAIKGADRAAAAAP